MRRPSASIGSGLLRIDRRELSPLSHQGLRQHVHQAVLQDATAGLQALRIGQLDERDRSDLIILDGGGGNGRYPEKVLTLVLVEPHRSCTIDLAA